MYDSDGGSALPGAARRRYLTILFSDLSGSTQLAAALEAEHYAELIGRVRQAASEIISKHGGTIVRIQGDGLLAIFGHPQAREGDGRRATEAALELHAAIGGLRFGFGRSAAILPLRLHTGIHAGLVLLGEGDLVLGRFELLGNAPNIAARLSDAAQDNEILVSEETLGPERHFFQTGERRQLDVRGASAPIAVYRILARAGIQTRFEARAQRGLAPFVGRQAELETLERHLRDSLTGHPRLVAISAGPGTGKTRLAEEFLRHAAGRDCGIHRGYCESYLSAEPLQPFLQMLKAMFGLQSSTSADLAAQALDTRLSELDPALLAHRAQFLRALSLGPAEPADPDTKRPALESTKGRSRVDSTPSGGLTRSGRSGGALDATIGALVDLFARLAARRPLVLFIDDWQWADDATSQVLNALRHRDSHPAFLLIATRGFTAGDAQMTDASVLELPPFTASEAAQTARQLLPGTDPFVLAEIGRHSGGNPLFLEELCHSAASDGPAGHRLRLHGGAAWLNVLIQSRVARLPPAQADVVHAAAVIGNVIPSWLLETLTGYGESHPLVRSLATQDLVFPGDQPGTLRFKHGITREVIYDSVGMHQRKAMHLRIAESTRQRSAAGGLEQAYEALAYHYGAGGDAGEACRYAELAGDKAVAASALDRAKAQYRAALAALEDVETEPVDYRRWMSIAQRFGLACVFDASREDLQVFQRAVALAAGNGDDAALARAAYWLGYISYALGEADAALAHCERALEAANRVGDDPLAVQVRATLGQIRAASGDYDQALSLLDEAIAVKRRHRTGARLSVGFAYSLACRAYVLGDRGLFAQAHDCFAEALHAVHGANHEVEASIRGWQSAVLLWQGRWETARDCAAEGARIGERVRSLFSFAMSRAAGSYASWMLERKPESLQGILDATSWLAPRRSGLFRSLNHGWLADALVSSARHAEARHHAAQALVRGRRRDLIGMAMAYRAMAQAAAQAGDEGRTRRYLALAMRAARRRDSMHEVAVTWLCEAGIALEQGRRAQAAPLLDQAQAAFERMDMAWHLRQAAEMRRAL